MKVTAQAFGASHALAKKTSFALPGGCRFRALVGVVRPGCLQLSQAFPNIIASQWHPIRSLAARAKVCGALA